MNKFLAITILALSTTAFSQTFYKRESPISKITNLDCLEFNNVGEPFASIDFIGAGFNHMSVMSSFKLCHQLKRAMKKEGFIPILAKFSNKDGVYEIEYAIGQEPLVITDKKAAKRAENAVLINY